MTEKINAHGIKINTNDIKEFLLRIGILKETQSGESCRVRLFINGEKIPINSIEDLASIKMENNKKIDRMNIDFYSNTTERLVALELCYDPEKICILNLKTEWLIFG